MPYREWLILSKFTVILNDDLLLVTTMMLLLTSGSMMSYEGSIDKIPKP